MSQKIYSDRTELEGVDLPSSGQTRNLVIDENKEIKSEAKPAPQSFDDVLGVGNETDKEARFISNDKYTIVKPDGMAVADEDVGSITQINSDSIELQKKTGSGKAKIVSYEDEVNTEHTLQPKSGVLAHKGDIVVFNQNPLNEVTVTGTTTSTSLLDVSSGTLTLTESDLEVGKTFEFQIYGKYTSSGDDFKLRFGVGASYVEITIPVSGTATNLPFRIIGSLDIVAVGGSPDAREYYFTGTIILRDGVTPISYENPILGNETVDDVTLGNDFTFSVVPTDNSSSFTCTKAILKRLN